MSVKDEENYLDNLLKNVMEPHPVEPRERETGVEEDSTIEMKTEEMQAESILEELAAEEPVAEEVQAESILEELAAEEAPQAEQEEISIDEIESLLAEVNSNSELIEEAPEEESILEELAAEDDLFKELDLDKVEEAAAEAEADDDDLFKELDVGGAEEAAKASAEEDDFEDVLSLLNDDDSELAEINDLLKKSDSKEPVQDDMMALLHQMADDEKQQITNSEMAGNSSEEDELLAMVEGADAGKSTKKASKQKTEAADAETTKKQGAFAKMFNALTEEFEPEPTEEELAKEAEEKAAAKLEAKTKKEEEKKAKAEEKKAKAEEKEAAKKAKAEANEQKKREKKEAREARLAEKRAKEEAERPKNQKRISPKKMVLVTIMAASVLVAVLLFSEFASTEGSLQRARRAYYAGDYQVVYLEMYGSELEESDALVQARSKVILKMQRKYDSYENHLKMGQEVEALNALIEGLGTYDSVNMEAEQYGVATEVDEIKTDILNVLQVNYGLDEAAARDLLQNEDEISYTKSLNHIIMRDSSDLASNS